MIDLVICWKYWRLIFTNHNNLQYMGHLGKPHFFTCHKKKNFLFWYIFPQHGGCCRKFYLIKGKNHYLKKNLLKCFCFYWWKKFSICYFLLLSTIHLNLYNSVCDFICHTKCLSCHWRWLWPLSCVWIL